MRVPPRPVLGALTLLVLAADLGLVAARRDREPASVGVGRLGTPAPGASASPAAPPAGPVELIHTPPADRFGLLDETTLDLAAMVRREVRANPGTDAAEVEQVLRGLRFGRAEARLWADDKTGRRMLVMVIEFGDAEGATRYHDGARSHTRESGAFDVTDEPTAIPGAFTTAARRPTAGTYGGAVAFAVGRRVHQVAVLSEGPYQPEVWLWDSAHAQHAHARKIG